MIIVAPWPIPFRERDFGSASVHVSTSHVERHNLTMRMEMRRFTRLTNGFSKKIENHIAMVAIHAVYYNFARIHKTLRITRQWPLVCLIMFGVLSKSL